MARSRNPVWASRGEAFKSTIATSQAIRTSLRGSLSPYLQQRDLVIDQDEPVRDLNWATRELAAESCSHRDGGLVLDRVQRLYRILILGLRVLLPGLYRLQTPKGATLIVHHRVGGKAVRQALHVAGGL